MGLKPMNCPAHFRSTTTSGTPTATCPSATPSRGCCIATSLSGVLHGLLRVRHFTQDDAHIFCTEDQVQEEVVQCLRFGVRPLRALRHRAAPGAVHAARAAHRQRRDVGSRRGSARGRPRGRGPGLRAQRGRRRLLRPEDRLRRDRRDRALLAVGTVQLDYSMPERFDLNYTGADNAEHRPVMIHRAMFGSFERFIAILIEHYAGEFPLWLAPVQAIVLPVVRPLQRVRLLGAPRSSAARSCGSSSTTARVGRAQDPRGGAAQDPLHARGGGAGAGRRDGLGARAPRRRRRRPGRRGVRPGPAGPAILVNVDFGQILTAPRVAFV